MPLSFKPLETLEVGFAARRDTGVLLGQSRRLPIRPASRRLGSGTESGGRQVFGAVAKVNTDIGVLIRRALDTIGRTGDTALTAFTDGCPGLRRILAEAGVTAPPMLDWFHLAMRLQHLKQVAGVLSDEDPARGAAKAMIIKEVERLRWRIWNGRAKNAQISIDRIRALLPSFASEPAR